MARWIVGSLWLVTFGLVLFVKLPPGPDIAVAVASYVLAAFTGLLWSDYIRNRPERPAPEKTT